MPRRPPFCGEFVYHVMNRAAKRTQLFRRNVDYIAIERLLVETKIATHMRVLSYCIMPNHWHLILWPTSGRQLSQFMRRLTGKHAQLWQSIHSITGSGAVYQGRYKAIPVQTGNYFYNVCRYVERNPLRAGLVGRAEEWPWSSCWRREHDESADLLDPWPVACPDDWVATLNAGTDSDELVRSAVKKGTPFGEPDWVVKTAVSVGLTSHLRHAGRPRRQLAGNCTRPLFQEPPHS
jgi:putative transposase